MTFPINDFIEIQKEMLHAQLKVLYRYQHNAPALINKAKRTSKLMIVKTILKNSGQPLHISTIIGIAQNEYHIHLERDSIVSALIKKINAGKTFVRVAPNTFSLKKESEHQEVQ